MPKTAPEKVVQESGGLQTVEISVSTGKGNPRKTVTFQRPTRDYFKSYVTSLPDEAPPGEESPLAKAWRLFTSALERATRVEEYETVATASTIVRLGKGKTFNLMDSKLPTFIKGYNGTWDRLLTLAEAAGIDPAELDEPENEDMLRALKRNVGFGPWQAARMRHEKEGRVKLADDGTISAVAA